jgi:hypothetical protein
MDISIIEGSKTHKLKETQTEAFHYWWLISQM